MAFPALVVQLGVASGQVTLALCARMLLIALALTAVVKVVMENSLGAWCYLSRRGMSVLGKSPACDFSQQPIGGDLPQKPTLCSCFASIAAFCHQGKITWGKHFPQASCCMASLQPVLLVAVSVREETSSRCPAQQPKLLPDDAGYVVAAFVAFPMPSVLPRHYWMFHSIWHVLLAAGQSALLWQLAPISNVPM